jgi:hypothetical protein
MYGIALTYALLTTETTRYQQEDRQITQFNSLTLLILPKTTARDTFEPVIFIFT